MKKKTNAKGKKRQMAAASRLKTRRAATKKGAAKSKKGKAAASRKGVGLKKKKSSPSASKAKKGASTSSAAAAKKIVRIMGQGQFTVDSKTLKRLNDLDNSIVELVNQERSDDAAFREKLAQLSEMVVSHGKALDPKAIIQSDIILPSTDLSIDEAKRLFKGEGVIPEI